MAATSVCQKRDILSASLATKSSTLTTTNLRFPKPDNRSQPKRASFPRLQQTVFISHHLKHDTFYRKKQNPSEF